MTTQFEADCEPDHLWPRVRFNFANGWSASVMLRTRTDCPAPQNMMAMTAALACCPTGRWASGLTELGETEASADEVAAYLAAVAEREPAVI